MLLSEDYFAAHESWVFRVIRRSALLWRLILRRVRLSRRPTGPPDWVTTSHSTNWARSEEFRRCYGSAVRLVGFDYRIPWRAQTLVWAASQARHLNGDFVELGTGRGFMMACVATYRDANFVNIPRIWCFDVFQKARTSGFGDPRHDFAYANSVREAQGVLGGFRSIELVEGDIRETLKDNGPDQIALLHLDLNDGDLESWAVKLIWDRLITGAVIVLDDYANRGMAQSESALLAAFHELGHEILSLPSGQGLVVKQSRKPGI